jgi:dihydrofolate synthase/folylpolyglutamate synthase
MNYRQTLRYLSEKGNAGIKPGLDRIKLLLEYLGNPERGVSYVHVAGTNGKGSVTSMLTSICEAAGLKAGRFISPHLSKWNERIHIGGRDITNREFSAAVSETRPAAERVAAELGDPSQFEIVTAAAFLLFKKAGVDVAVLEAGMGGLFDATNVVTPECTVITNIGLDHTEYLGSSLEAVAGEKAGIIKPGAPVVTAAESVALNVIIDKAASLRAPIYVLRADFAAIFLGGDLKEQRFLFRRADFTEQFTVGLGGDHQIANAALAVMSARLLAQKHGQITVQAMKDGLRIVKWPGRLELCDKAPDVILDGAHNVHGAAALRAALNKYRPGRPVCFVLGIMKDKDVKGMVEELLNPGDRLFSVAADATERAAGPRDIAAYGPAGSKAFSSLTAALKGASAAAGPDGVVCIAGSLYLAARVKDLWAKQEKRREP